MSGKLKSFFNSTVGQGDEIKSFIFAADGTAITQTGGALDVNIASGALTITEEDVYDEDSAHSSGDKGGFVLAVRRDTASSGVSADGDYASLNVDATGQLWVKDADVLAQLVSGVTVTASDLDIRDLAFATDSVDVSGSSVSITGDVNVTQGTSPWVVSATDLDIRDLAFATDSVDVSGSSVSISGSVAVTATDLDIRDLSSATDSVASSTFDGSGNAIGSLGGALRTTDHADTLAHSTIVIADTATAIAAAATQTRIMVQNLDSKTIYVGDSGVTSGAGYPVDKNEFIELPFSGTLYAITASGSTAAGSVRVLKLSA